MGWWSDRLGEMAGIRQRKDQKLDGVVKLKVGQSCSEVEDRRVSKGRNTV